MKFKSGDRVRHVTKGYTGTTTGDTITWANFLCYEVHWDSIVIAIDPDNGEEVRTSMSYAPEHGLELMKQTKGGNWESIWGDGAT